MRLFLKAKSSAVISGQELFNCYGDKFFITIRLILILSETLREYIYEHFLLPISNRRIADCCKKQSILIGSFSSISVASNAYEMRYLIEQNV